MCRTTYFLVVVILLSWSQHLFAQSDIVAQSGKWERVYTAEEFLVDAKPATLTYQPGRIIRLQFRTVFSQPESFDHTSKYKTRLETIEFRADRRYRYSETVLLDSKGKTLATYPASQDWKTFKANGVTNRLFDFAMSLSPFGHWHVTTYRYADGKPNADSDARDNPDFRGTQVVLQFSAAAVGAGRCSSPSYESHSLGDAAYYRKVGFSLEPLGINETQGDAVILKCESNEWAPPQSLILPLPTGNILLLWKGVFLELQKQHGSNRSRGGQINGPGAAGWFSP